MHLTQVHFQDILLNGIHYALTRLPLNPQNFRLPAEVLDGDGAEEILHLFPRLLPDEPGYALVAMIAILPRFLRPNAKNWV